jgi:glycosyltransferase involved in cell wall biosynthesis
VPESFGKAAVEAQAIGLPVVAANLGGQAETVRHNETGILFPAGEAGALAEAIQRILTMAPGEREAMTAAGEKRARTLYSASAMQSATLDLYSGLIEARAQQ